MSRLKSWLSCRCRTRWRKEVLLFRRDDCLGNFFPCPALSLHVGKWKLNISAHEEKYVLLASIVVQHNNCLVYPTEIHSIHRNIIHLWHLSPLTFFQKSKTRSILYQPRMCNNFPCAKVFYVLFVVQGHKRDSSSHSSVLFFRYTFTSNLTPSHKNIPFPGVFTKISSCPVCVVNRQRTEQLGSSPPDP